MCLDYRPTNKKTISDSYPTPDLQASIRRVADSKYFSALDLKAGYHNLPVAPSAKKYTGFITQDGVY